MPPVKLVRALALPAILIVLWQVLAMAGKLDPLFFPAPSQLLAFAFRSLANGALVGPIRATLSHLAAGFVIGALCGLGCGLAMGASRLLSDCLEPLISAIYSTPKLSLLPMLMLFLGVGSAPRVAVVATSCFILVATHALDAVRSIDRAYIDTARNYGAGRAAIFRKVYLPAALPQIFTGMRLALGSGLVMTVSAELVVPSDGLGSMILMGWQTFAAEQLYLGVFVTALLGMSLHAGLRRLERKVVRWREEFQDAKG